MRILIVDDSESNLSFMRRFLQGHGFEVFAASNGAEALDLAHRSTPDLIVTDILMPVMDGFALCRECKKDERLKSVPFIFYTATYTDEKDRNLALSLGAERFIVKPETPAALVAIIEETVRTRTGPQAAPSSQPDAVKESVFLRQYTEALGRKLQDKMQQLDAARRAMEKDAARRDAAEKALRESEERYRMLVELAPDVIYTLDAEGKIVTLNPAFEKITDWSRSDWIGKPFLDFVHPDDAAEAVKSFEATMRGEILPLFETRIRLKSGGYIYAEIMGNPVVERGRIVGEIGVGRDVTARKMAEQALRESEERYSTFINATGDMAFVKDDSLRYVMINEANARFFGRPPSEIIGLRDSDLMPPEAAAACRASDCQALETRRLVINEERVGDRVYETRKFPVNLRHGRLGVGGLIHDVTDRQQTEKAVAEQLAELRRWQAVMLDREDRMLALKREVNELLARAGKPPKYPSAVESGKQ